MVRNISIIIISLNEENYLPNLLNDLISQTEKHFDVVIVDAKSRDKTKEKALAFRDRLDMQFIESPKKQAAYQRNLGTKYAKNDYYFFLDADARLEPNALATCMHYINNNNSGVFIPMVIPSKRTFVTNSLFFIAVIIIKLLQRVGVALTFGPCVLIRKDIFATIGGYDEVTYVAEDHKLIDKVLKKGIKPVIMNDIHYIYSVRRFEKYGYLNTTTKYIYFCGVYLAKGVIATKRIQYSMGGQEFKKHK